MVYHRLLKPVPQSVISEREHEQPQMCDFGSYVAAFGDRYVAR